GKIKKKYNIHMTPYERLKSLKDSHLYLREGITFEILDKIAYAESDIEAGEKMRIEKKNIFKS
ncbi:MAG: hypothetical protein ACD_7C00506G0001, partial [uncultured bacterium]